MNLIPGCNHSRVFHIFLISKCPFFGFFTIFTQISQGTRTFLRQCHSLNFTITYEEFAVVTQVMQTF